MGFARNLEPQRNRSEKSNIYAIKRNKTPNIKSKRTASPFHFDATNYQLLGRFYSKIPMPNGTSLKIKTYIVPINVAFLIGLDIYFGARSADVF